MKIFPIRKMTKSTFYKQITQISEIKMEHRDKEHWEDAQKVGTRMVDTLGY